MAGPFNVTNAALAAEAVAALGYDDDDVAVALGRVRGVPGRFETVHAGQAFTVVIDYAHTPDGLEAVLAAAREITERTLTVVFGAGGDRDQGKRPQMGEVARRSPTGSSSRATTLEVKPQRPSSLRLFREWMHPRSSSKSTVVAPSATRSPAPAKVTLC